MMFLKCFYPRQILEELKKLNFTLFNQRIRFDEYGDSKIGSYSIVFWNQTGDAEEIGFYRFYPSVNYFINSSNIQWYEKEVSHLFLCAFCVDNNFFGTVIQDILSYLENLCFAVWLFRAFLTGFEKF